METQKKTVYVNYFDAINAVKVRAVMAVISDYISKQSPDVIYCLFSSPGGEVEAGITLYNFLRSLPVEFVMHNTGSIDSIANVVFLAANTRYASAHSSFLFHGVNWGFSANTNVNRTQITEILSGLNSSESKISGVITERSKLTAEEVRSLFTQGESKDPPFALSKGIISEIKNPQIPKGVPIASFNLG